MFFPHFQIMLDFPQENDRIDLSIPYGVGLE
jgi:hypothetical protein